MKRLMLIVFAAFSLLLAGLVASPGRAAAFDIFGKTCLDNNNQGTVCKEGQKSQSANGANSLYGPDGIITRVIVILDIIIGVVAVVMVIVGGFKMVLSGGDANQVNSARNTVLYALIGLLVAAAGQMIVKFVLNKL